MERSVRNNSSTQDVAALVGRILLAAIFISSGLQKLIGYSGTADMMAGAGLPMVGLLLPLTILVELGGGLAIAIGWHTRLAALAIVGFLLPVTYLFHNPAVDPSQAISMMKNIAIMGGMLHVVAFGSGNWSVDGRRVCPRS